MKIVAGNKRYTKKYAEGGEIILGGGSTADVQDRILEQGGTLAGNLETDNIGFAEGGEIKKLEDKLNYLESKRASWIGDNESRAVQKSPYDDEIYEVDKLIKEENQKDKYKFQKNFRSFAGKTTEEKTAKMFYSTFRGQVLSYDKFRKSLTPFQAEVLRKLLLKSYQNKWGIKAVVSQKQDTIRFRKKLNKNKWYEQGGTLAGNLETDNIGFAEGGQIQMGDMVNVVDINKSGVVTNVISNGKHFSVKFVDGSKGVYDRNEIQKIMSEEDYDEFESGGDIEQGNYQMMLSQAKEVKHHADELTNILKNETEIEAWVVAKMEDVSETLSDITHYLDGKSEYEQGGTLAGNLETDNIGFAKGGEFMRGGIAGDIYSLQNPEQFKQLISIYNYLSEKTDLIKGYYLDHTDNSVVFLTSPNISDIGKDKIYTYVESLNKKGFSIINFDKSIDYNKYEFGLHWGTEKSAMIEQDGMDGKANPQWFKLYLTSRIKYAKGGETHSHNHREMVDELDTHGNCVVDYDSMKNTYFWEDYKNDIYKDGFDTEEEAYESLAHHLQDKFKKGGTINSNKMARAKSKASSTGLKKAQTTRWTAYTTKAGQTKHKVEDKPYKVSSDKKRPATPSGYRFSKVAEEKGITNNRFRRPTKAEIEKYANKKTKSGQLIMYKENRKNKVDLNPKSRI